jgi:hypothetical protein
MDLGRLGRLGRRWLPHRAFDAARRVGTAALTPLVFSVQSGHLRSSLSQRATDRRGAPLPWYTYPAIAFISRVDFGSRRILEWGAGQSTLWWAARAREVVSLELDPGWFAALSRQVPGNVALHLLRTGEETTVPLAGPFDVIVVDGCDRLAAARRSVSLATPGTVVVFDNSEGHWGPDDRTHPIIDLMTDAGFARVDFYGHAPGVVRQHCTSLFFRDADWMLRGSRPPTPAA